MPASRVLVPITFTRNETGEWHATSTHQLLQGVEQHGRTFDECRASVRRTWGLLLTSQGETREIDWREEILH